jgi:hypothetical protein
VEENWRNALRVKGGLKPDGGRGASSQPGGRRPALRLIGSPRAIRNMRDEDEHLEASKNGTIRPTSYAADAMITGSEHRQQVVGCIY